MGFESISPDTKKAQQEEAARHTTEFERDEKMQEVIKQNNFEIVDGISVENYDGSNKHTIDNREVPFSYDSNNNVLAVTDKEGKLYVTPWSPALVQKLERSGFMKRSMGVPLSNGELPSHPSIKDRWQLAWQKRRREEVEEQHQEEQKNKQAEEDAAKLARMREEIGKTG
ncbi:MAG: hypothetical protein Q8R34_02650 [bacterium]|nr:hypothetical protein [bacterium]